MTTILTSEYTIIIELGKHVYKFMASLMLWQNNTCVILMSTYDSSGRRRSNMEAGVEKESGMILKMDPWMSKINADNGKLF